MFAGSPSPLLASPDGETPFRVLILDGETRTALAVTRSLVSAGFESLVGSTSRFPLAGMSRGARYVRIAADPLDAPVLYRREVVRLARAHGTRIVLPVTDASAEAILSGGAEFDPGTVFPFPSYSIFHAASDKLAIHRIATELGIGIPSTVVVESASDIAALGDSLFPAVIKPHRSVIGEGQHLKVGVSFVRSAEECRRALLSLPAAAFPVLVQRRVYGSGEGVFIARWSGRTIAQFAHRRLREKPPAGGTSVYSESMQPDAEVLEACEQLLDRLAWQGVAMIEGKRDSSTGRWGVIEVNGRFWGSLQLAIDSGVDFPAILMSAAIEQPLRPPPEWTSGVRLRSEWGDVDHLALRLFRSRATLALSADAPTRWQALLEFLRWRTQDRLELLRCRDPLPFFIECLRWLRVLPE